MNRLSNQWSKWLAAGVSRPLTLLLAFSWISLASCERDKAIWVEAESLPPDTMAVNAKSDFVAVAVSGPPANSALSTEPQPINTSVFNCNSSTGDKFSFVVRSGSGELAVWLPLVFGRPYLVLAQSPAASGSKYEGDDVVVWTHGDEALLEVAGDQFPGCKLNRARSIWEHAKLGGVDFRAVGNEPGWYLEIRNSDSMKFVYDYGQVELIAPAPAPSEEPGSRQATYTVQNESYALVVRILGTPCIDSMTGEQFETNVVVDLDGRSYQGCGRALH